MWLARGPTVSASSETQKKPKFTPKYEHFGEKVGNWQHQATVVAYWSTSSRIFHVRPDLQLLKLEQTPETNCINPLGLETGSTQEWWHILFLAHHDTYAK